MARTIREGSIGKVCSSMREGVHWEWGKSQLKGCMDLTEPRCELQRPLFTEILMAVHPASIDPKGVGEGH